MNEDREVIRLVNGNRERIEQRRADEAACKARKREEKRRMELAVSRLLWNCLLACLVILGCYRAMGIGRLSSEQGTLAVLLAVLYIGVQLGRFIKEVR